MKTTEIVGFNRENLGTSFSKLLRAEGNAPCVVYGGSEEPIHFHAPMYLFKELLYTPNAYIVNLNVEGKEITCILKDVQFHPVNETILHVDFFRVSEEKEIVIDIPVKIVGVSDAVKNGGKLFMKMNKLTIKGLIKNLPDYIDVSIDGLELGKSVRVAEVATKDFSILNSDQVTIASVIIPRALKTAAAEEGEEGEEEGEEEA